MSMRMTLIRGGMWILFGMLLAVLANCGGGTSSEKPPNILLIMTDDQGWGDIRSHGNSEIETPVLDNLAESGVRFDRFYVSPVCAPTRASLLTGRYYLRTGVHGVTRGYETMRAEEVTIAELAREAGYATGCFGKWHNGAHYPSHPNGQGFDEFFGFCAGHWNNYFDTWLERNGQPVETRGYITDVLTDEAIRFIEGNRNKPFFCYVPYNAPHSPWQVPDNYYEKYSGRGLDSTTATAYAMVENIDDNVGRLLETLDELGLTEETIVLFLTDNGPNSDRYNGNMKGRKGSMHEGGMRVPFFIRWPGKIEPKVQVEEIAAHIDILPTLVDLCGFGSTGEFNLDGVSLAPLLMGREEHLPERMIFQRWGGWELTPERGAVRTQRWRAVKYEAWELYDMQTDPEQKQDLAGERPELVKGFESAYQAWLEEVTARGFAPIPIPLGHAERSRVTLPGHEAFLYPEQGKGISYHGSAGWANDWIDNWTSTDSYPYWKVDVLKAGTFALSLSYACAEDSVGTRIQVEIGGSRVAASIRKAHNPEFLHSPDRVPRKEVYEREWAELDLGEVELPLGETELRVRAQDRPGEEVIELKRIVLQAVE